MSARRCPWVTLLHARLLVGTRTSGTRVSAAHTSSVRFLWDLERFDVATEVVNIMGVVAANSDDGHG
jgi:hypothetical protein